MEFVTKVLLLCTGALVVSSSNCLLMKKLKMKGAMGSMMMYHPPEDYHMMPASMPMMMPFMGHPIDMSMMMMMMGMPMMPMNDGTKTQMSMEDTMSLMSRMKNRAQAAHETADIKMKMHLKAHEQKSEDPKAPCQHMTMAAHTAQLAASRKKAEERSPCTHDSLLASPAPMNMTPMLSQPLTQMSSALMPNGAMSAPLMLTQMMPAMPMAQVPMQSQAMPQPMSMMASAAFPQNVVATASMDRQS